MTAAPDPNLANTLYQQALNLHQQQRYEEALGYYDKAIVLKPDFADAYNDLGLTLLTMGRSSEALISYELAITHNPQHIAALSNRGNLLLQMNRAVDALASYDTAIDIAPSNAIIHFNRGKALQKLERLEEALAAYDKAIELDSVIADFHNSRGFLLNKMKRYNDALKSCKMAASLRPDFPEAYDNQGNALQDMGQYEEALTCYDKALALRPDFAVAHNNRGNTLQEMGQYGEVLKNYDKAIALDPGSAMLYCNRGANLQKMGRYDEALTNFDKAVSIDPNYADAYFNKALLKLTLGEYEEGWKLYEWRWKNPDRTNFKLFQQQVWSGKESLAGKTLLLHMEQGLGDAIQLCRYIPQVTALGAKVILRVPSMLTALISSLKADFQLVTDKDPVPHYDYHCPLFNLPLAFKTTVKTIPANVPYLYADAAKLKHWQEKLGKKTKLRVGLVWAGSIIHKNDRNRSIPSDMLAPLLLSQYEFHSLQKEYKPADAAFMKQHYIATHADDLKDLTDTAALIAEMDIVISVDTSVAHLAGALAIPVWLMLTHVPDFRWLLERSDSPWYPTARLFRQSTVGDWASAINQVKTALEHHAQ